MTGKYFINGADAYLTYGIVFTEGTIRELIQLPRRKPGYTKNWPDENGTERDLSVSVFESRQLNLPMILIGTSRSDFQSKLLALEAVLTSGAEVILDGTDVGRRFRLVYQEMQSITDLEFHSSGRCFAAFTLSFIDDYPTEKFAIA